MQDSYFYIEEIKKNQGIESDYAAAKLLGVSRQALSKYKNKKLTFDGDILFKVSELSGHPVPEILFNIKASKSKDPEYMKKWARLARQFAGTAAGVILSMSMLTYPAGQVDGATIAAKTGASTVYIMLSNAVVFCGQCFASIKQKIKDWLYYSAPFTLSACHS